MSVNNQTLVLNSKIKLRCSPIPQIVLFTASLKILFEEAQFDSVTFTPFSFASYQKGKKHKYFMQISQQANF